MRPSVSTCRSHDLPKFQYVSEWGNEFLTLFPHRFDYIWAEHPNPGGTVEWRTETRYPLGDRLICQGAYLYGVRFGAETNYCLLDIDVGSLYHPKRDPFAIDRIVAALEPIGLVSYVICTSSYSGGLHLYFPFQEAQSSWQLAIAVACLLENVGFKLQPGQLESFPNPKPYTKDGNVSLFNAHRFPLQTGSYLLDRSLQPIWSNTQAFVQQWQMAQQHNDIDKENIKQILKQAKRKPFGISGKAEKFINDLNAEIELGWTGHGQTNRLLGRITMRTYIFHHVLSGGTPLEGHALVNEIVETARSLPGYQEWCRHQHEIEHRAEEWARCIENSRYFHFGESRKPKPEVQNPEVVTAIEKSPSWNERQSSATRDRIRRAIADMLETDSLPAKPTARFQSLLKYGIGGASLYRHRDLWHPDCLKIDFTSDFLSEDDQVTDNSTTNNCQDYPSLLFISGGDNLFHNGFGDRIPSNLFTEDSYLPCCSLFLNPLEDEQRVQQCLFPAIASKALDAAFSSKQVGKIECLMTPSHHSKPVSVDNSVSLVGKLFCQFEHGLSYRIGMLTPVWDAEKVALSQLQLGLEEKLNQMWGRYVWELMQIVFLMLWMLITPCEHTERYRNQLNNSVS